MTDARYDLGNGLVIDADNPETHETPNYCRKCEVIYYFGHYCTDRQKPSKAFKRGMQGYYDGE